MEIDQAGHERRRAEIDDARAGRRREIDADGVDALATDDHGRRRERRAAAAVDEACRANHDDGRWGRRLCEHTGRQQDEGGSCELEYHHALVTHYPKTRQARPS